jgi:pyruvate dehydrogenase (quinone)
VTWEQRAMEGDPKNPMTQNIPDVHYAEFARMIGLDGVRIDSPDAIDAAWEEAFAADRPFVIDAVCDPEVPPLPPHITVEQAKHFISAVKGGDPHSRRVMTESFRQKILEFLPGR